ncbi:MAG: hypothetical protein WAK63_14325, partial [Xanthobacteraceae bacterium]
FAGGRIARSSPPMAGLDCGGDNPNVSWHAVLGRAWAFDADQGRSADGSPTLQDSHSVLFRSAKGASDA